MQGSWKEWQQGSESSCSPSWKGSRHTRQLQDSSSSSAGGAAAAADSEEEEEEDEDEEDAFLW
jgi:hypothetical protein